jgi:hypothetical protein
MEVIITFLARWRKVGESDLGALLSAVTEKCPGQEAKGRNIPAGTGCCSFNSVGAGVRGRGIEAGMPSGKPWWKRTAASWGAV